MCILCIKKTNHPNSASIANYWMNSILKSIHIRFQYTVLNWGGEQYAERQKIVILKDVYEFECNDIFNFFFLL